MTISSLAKIIVGVNRMVVENVEIEYPEINTFYHGNSSRTRATPVSQGDHSWLFFSAAFGWILSRIKSAKKEAPGI